MEIAEQQNHVRTYAPHIVAIVSLLVAIPWDGSAGYFSMLRWVVCAAFLFLAFDANAIKQERWKWLWGVLAGIYNPVIPVHASEELWILVDLIAIGITSYDLFVRHEALAKFRRFFIVACTWAITIIFRLALACAGIALLFIALDFAITRWG